MKSSIYRSYVLKQYSHLLSLRCALPKLVTVASGSTDLCDEITSHIAYTVDDDLAASQWIFVAWISLSYEFEEILR